MPIIEPPPTAPKKETVAIRLEVSVLDELRRYAAYVGTRNFSHIIACSLERVFKADAGYKAWLKAHPDFHPESKSRRNGAAASDHGAPHSGQPSSPVAMPSERHGSPRTSIGGE
jgi:hypothetical protein